MLTVSRAAPPRWLSRGMARSEVDGSGSDGQTSTLTREPCVSAGAVVPGHNGGGCEIRTREGLHPTRFPGLRACVR
jgi:hypothetical protein